MTKRIKLYGEVRRSFILDLLKKAQEPITGRELATHTNVSRQVIVGDITLLKARKEPIIATSQGYIYLMSPSAKQSFERIVACRHSPEETETELNLLVDLGVTVKDVKIEHPVYGNLTASIMVGNRFEVKQFIEKIKTSKAAFLSELTGGYHLHTISAADEKTLDLAEKTLTDAYFLVDNDK